MFGIRHIKFDSMTYVIHFKNGRIKRQGRGLSFFYTSYNSSISAIPMGSNDLPFIFNESTKDYQTVSIQGQISYKIKDPNILSEILDFTINDKRKYKKNDIEKLNQRLINEAQTSTSAYIHNVSLRDAIRSAKSIEKKILDGLFTSAPVGMLGIEILGANILSVTATPEMARALETETREKLQQEADQAIYERRNFAVEQERRIKESELNTEIAVEEKKKQITEKRMETDIVEAEKDRKLREMTLEADIAIEEQKKILVDQRAANEKKEADTKGYVLETTLAPYKKLDWKLITALGGNNEPAFNISLAFRELAENAGKIGNLNVSPELLESILKSQRGD